MDTIANNHGGIRDRDAGDFFPFRVVPTGTPDNLAYWVYTPEGKKLTPGYMTCAHAVKRAQKEHKLLNLSE